MDIVKNTDTLVYALNKSYLQLEDILPTLGDDQKEVYYYVSDTISRIINCYERINGLDLEEFEFVSALKFVNNCLKHNPSLQFFHIEIHGMATFPTKLDGRVKSVLHAWNPLDNVRIQEKFKNVAGKQIIEYRKYLEGKVILSTLRYYVRQINLVHMKCDNLSFQESYMYKYTLAHDWKTVLTNGKKVIGQEGNL